MIKDLKQAEQKNMAGLQLDNRPRRSLTIAALEPFPNCVKETQGTPPCNTTSGSLWGQQFVPGAGGGYSSQLDILTGV